MVKALKKLECQQLYGGLKACTSLSQASVTSISELMPISCGLAHVATCLLG